MRASSCQTMLRGLKSEGALESFCLGQMVEYRCSFGYQMSVLTC